MDGIDVTNIGYIDGMLHIQTAVADNLETDNHGYFYLKDNQGNTVQSLYTFNHVNQFEPSGRIDYSNYVFDVPQQDIGTYTLHGNFVTAGMHTRGDWSVTFALEQAA